MRGGGYSSSYPICVRTPCSFRHFVYVTLGRSSGGSNLGIVARHTHVFQELGITRGQYTGLLPLLVRHGVASLFLMPEQDEAETAAADAAGSGGGGWEEVSRVLD